MQKVFILLMLKEKIRISQHKSGLREKPNLLLPGFQPLINPTKNNSGNLYDCS
jgi:hypothetical protein